LGLATTCSVGRGPHGVISLAKAKQEHDLLARFEQGSALSLTLTHEGDDPRSQQVRAPEGEEMWVMRCAMWTGSNYQSVVDAFEG